MKKGCVLLCLLLLLCAAANAEESPWDFDGVKRLLTDYRGPGGEVTVPGQIGGVPVYRTASGLFSGREDITEIRFEEGPQVIGISTLNGVSGLKRVLFPQSLRAIETSNVFSCAALEEAIVPCGVGYVGQNCFSWSGQLGRITFEGSCPFFEKPESCFKQLPGELVILVPDDALDAYREALPHVREKIQPSGRNAKSAPVTQEGDFTVTNGKVTAYRGEDACVVIPASVGGEKVIAIGDNVFMGFNAYTVSIPEGVTEIGNGAFRSGDHLYGVKLPSTLRTIGEDAFRFFYGNRVTLPEGLQTIGARAFYDASLTRITLPSTLKSVGSQVFANCRSLKTVTLRSDRAVLPADAFEGCGEIEFLREDPPTPAPKPTGTPKPLETLLPAQAIATPQQEKPLQTLLPAQPIATPRQAPPLQTSLPAQLIATPQPVTAQQPAQNGKWPIPDIRYVCTGAVIGGVKRDASFFNGESSVVFHSDGTVTAVLMGSETAGFTWSADGERAVIRAYGGQELVCEPEGRGFVMNYFGSMEMEFAPQE